MVSLLEDIVVSLVKVMLNLIQHLIPLHEILNQVQDLGGSFNDDCAHAVSIQT